MTLPYRGHTVRTTYFSVRGYLILPLFTNCREQYFSETRLNSGVLFLLAGLREIGGK